MQIFYPKHKQGKREGENYDLSIHTILEYTKKC